MKKQSFKDRMHEHEGMEKSHHMHHSHHKAEHHPHHHLHEEKMRHEGRLHHETAMHHGMSHGTYKHQVDEPHVPHENHVSASQMGMNEFFNQADPIAHGQSTGPDMMKDDHRIHSQFKNYYWD